MQRADQDIGQPREHVARLLGGNRSREDARTDQEHVFLAEQADRIEHILVAAGLAERTRQLGFKPRRLRQRAEEARVDQRIDDVRVLRQDVGETGRDAENERDEANELRILPQQRQQTSAGAQAGEELIEGGERRVRVFRLRELVDDDRDKRDQVSPRLLAAQGAVSGRVPALHRGGNLARLPKTHFRQPIERLALALRRRERQILPLREQGGRALKQPDIMRLDFAQMRQQHSGEIVAIFEAEKPGERTERLAIGRQSVRLLVGHHLQAVLDAAQEIIGRRQFVARRGVDPAVRRQRGKRPDGRTTAQPAMAAAGNELLGLHEKFDLADAAASKLDVMTLDRDLAVTAVGVDLLLHGMHVGDRRVIEIFAPDEGRQIAEQPFAGGDIAGARPRLDERRALPVLAPALVIIERGFGRDGDLGRRRIGTQP